MAVICLFTSCTPSGEPDGGLIIEEGENIVKLTVSDVDGFNPITTSSESVRQMLTLIYEPLYKFNEDLSPIPCLAENLEFADSTHAILRLGSANWQDGSKFCAADVVYTINQIKSTESVYKHNADVISSAIEQADGTVWIEFTRPVMNAEGYLSFPIIQNNTADIAEELPSGTGAFVVSEKSASSMKLLPNPLKQKGSVDAVVVKIMRSNEACINVFETNEADVLTSAVIDLGVKTPAGDINTENYTSNRMTFLGFNCGIEKYSQAYLRLVVSAIIDRRELADTATFGRASACRLPFNPSAWFYSEADMLELDIAGTLEMGGYTLTDGLYYDQNGAQLIINILVTETSSQKIKAAEMIASKLSTAGIAAIVEKVPYTDYISRIKSGEYDTFLGEMEMEDSLDPGFITDAGNYFFYSDDNLSASVAMLREARNTDELKNAFVEYDRAFSANPPFAVLYFAQDGVVYSKNISGITAPNFYQPLTGLENWYFKTQPRVVE